MRKQQDQNEENEVVHTIIDYYQNSPIKTTSSHYAEPSIWVPSFIKLIRLWQSFALPHHLCLTCLLQFKRSIMNRRSEEQTHIDVLQSKYPIKERQRTLGVLSGKSQPVTLSDLCPQDKLKIGELIKINEIRKQEINELNEKQVSLQSALADSHTQLLQIQQQHRAKDDQLQEVMRELAQLKLANSQMQRLIVDLRSQGDLLKQQVNKRREIILKVAAVQTEDTPTATFATQTKKVKQKAYAIQTEDLKQNHSSGTQERSQNNSIERNRKERSVPYNQSRSNRESKDSFAKSRGSKHHLKRYLDEGEIAEDDVDECFEQLTKKWLHLKQKNLSKLKASYEDSKYKFGRDVEAVPEPSPFLEEERVTVTQQTDPQDLDESQLNALLKSKDFSASRLLTGKRIISDNPNSRKQSYYLESLQTDQTYQEKIKREPLERRQHKLNIQTKKEKKVLGPKIDAGEGDLMDLVDSLW